VIVDAKGKPLRRRNTINQQSAIVFTSSDLDNWTPMKMEELPDTIRNPDVMALLIQGEVVSLGEDEGPFYIAELAH
jgi:hypothetical protein